MFLTRFGTYKIATPPKHKPRRGRGLRQTNTCCKVHFQVNFFRHMALPSINLIFYGGMVSGLPYYLLGGGEGGGHEYYLPPFLAV
jgi:hypothetical protein